MGSHLSVALSSAICWIGEGYLQAAEMPLDSSSAAPWCSMFGTVMALLVYAALRALLNRRRTAARAAARVRAPAEAYVLTSDEERLLASCVDGVFRQVVWDVNAVYLVRGETDCIKIEVTADGPPPNVRSGGYDEVVFIRVKVLPRSPHFASEGEDGLCYRVLAADVRIQAVKIARTAVVFPSGRPALPSTVDEQSVTVDAGVLLTLDDGLVLPAVLLHNSFGFATWPELRLYPSDDVDECLERCYSLRAPAADEM